LFHFSFEYARQNHYTKVTFADKPNVLRKSSIFAREIFEEIAACYPEIKAEIHNVDAVALWLVRRPEEFGVIVAENMFGDILSDLAGGVMGGLGFAPSANIGMKNSYFEPVHGSAPRVKLNTANPSAMFLTIGLMLDHLGYSVEAKKIHMALVKTIQQGKYLTYDLDGLASTQDMAQAIIGNL
jgi:isocitrate/isopropylmalate dehydrogenase